MLQHYFNENLEETIYVFLLFLQKFNLISVYAVLLIFFQTFRIFLLEVMIPDMRYYNMIKYCIYVYVCVFMQIL